MDRMDIRNHSKTSEKQNALCHLCSFTSAVTLLSQQVAVATVKAQRTLHRQHSWPSQKDRGNNSAFEGGQSDPWIIQSPP